ncbi:hypothetical protein [Candidatus Poriferisodalis sp.]|uniref:hypothetical protein n=1 Tax=Candidatus Poriferisodalis sp. TaxID=3101277 RepID=UPI003C6FE86C
MAGMLLGIGLGCSTGPRLVRLADWPQQAEDEGTGRESGESHVPDHIADLRFYNWKQAKRCDDAWLKAFTEEIDYSAETTDRVENISRLLNRMLASFEKQVSHPGDVSPGIFESATNAEMTFLRFKLEQHHADLTDAYRACVIESAFEPDNAHAEAKELILGAVLMISHGVEDVAAVCGRTILVGGEIVLLDCRLQGSRWWDSVSDYVPKDLLMAYPGELPTEMYSQWASAIESDGGPPFSLEFLWPTYPINYAGPYVSWAHEEPRTVLWGMLED